MTTTKHVAAAQRREQRPSATRRVAVVFGVVGALALAWLLFGWRTIPQLSGDEDAFRSVDALFTAVTAHNQQLVTECAERLAALQRQGKLPAESAGYLDSIVAQARDGRWQTSSERLYEFMLAQRRSEH